MIGFLLPRLAWFAFIALAPIAIHLLNRIRLRRVPFSSLIFLKEVRRERFNWLRLKELLLLILRTAVLLFLFLGLSRPFLKSGLFGVKREASAVVIIDNSMSMRYGSSAEKAVRGAKEYLSGLTGSSEAALLTSTAGDMTRIASIRDRVPGQVLTRDMRRLTDDLDSIQFGYTGADLAAAVEQARALLANATLPQREIVIFTDLQKRAIDPVPPNDDRRIAISIRDCGSPDWSNCAVISVAPLERLPEPGRPVTLAARIHNYGRADVTRTAVLNVDNVSESKSVIVPAGADKTVEFGKEITEPGEHAATVALDPDSLTADDTAHHIVRIPSRISVLIAGDMPDDILYLSKALAPESLGFFQVDTRLSATLRTADLRQYKVVGLVNPVILSAFDWQRIEEYLHQGGSVFIALSKEPQDKSLLSRFITYGEEVQSPGFVTIERSDSTHPILETFKGQADLSLPRFFRHARVEPVNASVLASFSDGSPFLLEGKSDRVIIATSDLRLDGTDLPFRALFLPLMHRIFSYLGQELSDRDYTVGDTITVPAPSLGMLKVRTPEGEYNVLPDTGDMTRIASGASGDMTRIAAIRDRVPGQEENRVPGQVRFAATALPGIYQLGDHSYAVNVPSAEGDLTRASTQDLAQKHITITEESRLKTRDLTNALLIIAGLCLAAEMLILVL